MKLMPKKKSPYFMHFSQLPTHNRHLEVERGAECGTKFGEVKLKEKFQVKCLRIQELLVMRHEKVQIGF